MPSLLLFGYLRLFKALSQHPTCMHVALNWSAAGGWSGASIYILYIFPRRYFGPIGYFGGS